MLDWSWLYDRIAIIVGRARVDYPFNNINNKLDIIALKVATGSAMTIPFNQALLNLSTPAISQHILICFQKTSCYLYTDCQMLDTSTIESRTS